MKKPDIWTPPKLVQWIREDFKCRGFPSPHRLEAEHLVSAALHISRLDIYLQYDRPCSKTETLKLREMVKRRYRREPLAYILGNCEFWNISLRVGPGVLIPRRETEILVQNGLDFLTPVHDGKERYILDFGTGTGAISLALASEMEHLRVLAVDNSVTALQYALSNVNMYKEKNRKRDNSILLVRTNTLHCVNRSPRFDIIISNPPYIPENDIPLLQPEVQLWEPNESLNGGKSGLDYYHLLKNNALDIIKPDGYLIVEHGFDQKEQIQTIFENTNGFSLIKSAKDYSHHDRVLVYQKTDNS